MDEKVLKQIIETDWEKIVQRQQALLMTNNLIVGCDVESTKQVLGTDTGYEHYLYLDSEVFLSQKESEQVSKQITELVEKEGLSKLKEFLEKWLKIGDGILSYTARFSPETIAQSPETGLKKTFSDFFQKNKELATALLIPLGIEKTLENKIRKLLEEKGVSSESLEDHFLTLTFPHRNDFSTEEMISLYTTAVFALENNEDLSNPSKKLLEEINTHLKRFGWINTRWLLGEPWETQDIIQRIKVITKEDCASRLAELKSLVNDHNESTKGIMEELNFTKEERDLVETTKRYVFIRGYRTDVFNKAMFSARPLLKETAKRFGYTFKEITFLGTEEILALFDGKKVPKEIIAERIDCYGIANIKGDLTIFSKKEVESLKQKLGLGKIIQEVTELHGSIANKGLAKGRARIVLGKEDLPKVQEGDILIAPMTEPDFVPAMERAAAFVTDEGGILCHAAIISRELDKPCITGTKNATTAIKDNDLIEVNANNGIVRILEK